ncbi:sn-glycerol-3-phosphate import ATP-binding protein UgpC [Vreelandella massiliensis]|uniref:sn-glycerol-3-phosphate import ATP-binding protein UgpC n=1 Tax=Vreelandella massiliensis TaxID=1816686 RepID=UPI00096A2C5B|nr:sn-glycerol-3-phosphate import ATP-binding protein UgpC [Halomonas massiliensis]
MASITLSGVRKSYGTTQVIHGVDLTIEDGEFVVIVGPSGCGKSTLLRMVAGLEEITEGTVDIDGHVVNRLEPKDRDIAMVFQNYALYPHMSVRQNMAYGLKMRKMSKADIEKRVTWAAGVLQLTDLLDRRPGQLSGGQRQRVAMGRAMVRSPAAFLFDEPLSNLDAKLRVQMRLEIKRLQQELRTTSLYVTHDQVEAMTMADRLVVMNGGVAEQIGTPMEIYERPRTVFVAGFIGSPNMNFLPARLDSGMLALGQGLRVACPHAPEEANGRDVTLGIRPEHLVVAEQGEPADVQFIAHMVEPLGAETLLHGRFDGVEANVALRLHGTPDVQRDARLPLRLRPDALHLFDPASGVRLTE